MILAKCCHDLDLIQYYAASECESVSSVGDLVHFKAENAPEGAAKRCTECKYIDTCPASAKRIYVDRWNESGRPTDRWPYNVLVSAPITEEKLTAAITEGNYGRCVYACDNNVVDHQFTQMTFKNGVKASLLMTAFTHGGGRRYQFHGTLGELILDEDGEFVLKEYGKAPENITLVRGDDKGYGHGGGDYFLIQSLYDMLSGNATPKTAFSASVESHLMGIAAEESRLLGGELRRVH